MGNVPPAPDYEIPKAVTVKVECMLHGDKSIRGNHAVYPLGHGRTYQLLEDVTCLECTALGHDARWLKLVFTVDETKTVTVTSDEYIKTLMAAMNAEFGAVEADSDDEPGCEVVTESPSTQLSEPAPLIQRPPLMLGGSP